MIIQAHTGRVVQTHVERSMYPGGTGRVYSRVSFSHVVYGSASVAFGLSGGPPPLVDHRVVVVELMMGLLGLLVLLPRG